MAFSERLREERKRLKFNQSDFGSLGGVTKKSQVAYEGGSLPPYVDYLEKISAAGVDIQYLFTGERSDMALTPEERELLWLYRKANSQLKKVTFAALVAGVGEQHQNQKFVINGDIKGGVFAHTIGTVKQGGKP